MDRLKQRIQLAERALATLRVVLAEPKSAIVRGASIQRFEYTFEAVWKTAQLYLRTQEGLEVSSPKGVVRACGQAELLAEAQLPLVLSMVDDRNLTAHTYDEALAEALYGRLAGHRELMEQWLRAIASRLRPATE
jgi:nucleotidyltransferase substrate binding protein (TIGR01987 family)